MATGLLHCILLLSVISVSPSPHPQLPSLALTLPPFTKPTTGGSIMGTINNFASGLSNAACEKNPTGLLCNTSVALGHKILQQLPGALTIRHCSVFLASPHCCAQFCSTTGAGGSCYGDTGACFCNPTGPPQACQMLITTDNYTTAGMNKNDLAVLDICRGKCASNANGCTKPAAITDGIVGTVCFCYC